MSVAKGFRLSDDSTAKLDWNYVTKPDGSKSIIEEVNDVKQDLAELEGGGLSDDAKQALLACFQNVAWIGTDGDDYYQDLYDALYAIQSISVSPSTLSFGVIDSTQQLTATTNPVGANVTWTSSDTSVAIVSSSGLVTAKGYGTATITASAGGKTAICTVTIVQAQTYTVTNTLTKAITSNDAEVVAEGNSYSATISGVTGYTVPDANIVVTMGGNTLSGVVSSGVITISNVTGNIVITATGELKGTNLMTDISTTFYVSGYTELSNVDGYDFTARNKTANGLQWGSSIVQQGLQIPSDQLTGKTIFCEFDLDAVSGATSDTYKTVLSIGAFDRANPTGGSQRKGSKGLEAYTVGHYSLEIPVSDTEIELSSSYYFGIMFFFYGTTNYQVTVKNVAYTYY